MYLHLPIQNTNTEPSNMQRVGTASTNSFSLCQSLLATNEIQSRTNFPDKSVTWKLSALLQLQLEIKQRLSPKQPGLLDSCPTKVVCLYKPFSCSTLLHFACFFSMAITSPQNNSPPLLTAEQCIPAGIQGTWCVHYSQVALLGNSLKGCKCEWTHLHRSTRCVLAGLCLALQTWIADQHSLSF